MIQNTTFMTQNNLFVTQNNVFYGISADGWKTYALGERNPESLQDGRTSSEMRSPGDNWLNKLVLTYSQSQMQLWWRSSQKKYVQRVSYHICGQRCPSQKAFFSGCSIWSQQILRRLAPDDFFQLMLIIMPTLLKIEELEMYYCYSSLSIQWKPFLPSLFS